MKLLLLLSCLSFSALSIDHHETIFEVWCKTGSSTSAAVKKLNKSIASAGHGLVGHHLKVKSVSAPSITTDAHALHHEVVACATVTAVKSH